MSKCPKDRGRMFSRIAIGKASFANFSMLFAVLLPLSPAWARESASQYPARDGLRNASFMRLSVGVLSIY